MKQGVNSHVFRPSATVSQIGLMESHLCHHCHGGTPPPNRAPPWYDNMMDVWVARPLRWRSVLVLFCDVGLSVCPSASLWTQTLHDCISSLELFETWNFFSIEIFFTWAFLCVSGCFVSFWTIFVDVGWSKKKNLLSFLCVPFYAIFRRLMSFWALIRCW